MRVSAQEYFDFLMDTDQFRQLYYRQWSESSDSDLSEFLEIVAKVTHDPVTIDGILNLMKQKDNPRVRETWYDPSLRDWMMQNIVLKVPQEVNVKPDITRFNHYDQKGNPTSAYDLEIIKDIMQEFSILMVGGTPYLYDGISFKPDTDGTLLKASIREHLEDKLVKSNTITRIFNLLTTFPEIRATGYDQMNQYPPHWVCFQNGFYDPKSQTMIPHDPKYRAINPIPHKFVPGAYHAGKEIDTWLKYIAPHLDEREMLLQYYGLCMTKDTGQQKILIICGEAGSGKSTLLDVNAACIGKDNMSHVSMQQLSQRFYSHNLVGKLVNSCGDLDATAMENTGEFKKMTGEDPIIVERKGCDPITYQNYARLLFSTNQLPIIKDERTNGFFRRVMILPVSGQHETIPHYEDKLIAEIDHFIHLAMDALHRMYSGTGIITESQSSKDAVKQMRRDSDSVQAWLDECTVQDSAAIVPRKKLYMSYADEFCLREERTPLKPNAFYKALREKSYSLPNQTERVNDVVDRYCHGIRLVTGNSVTPATVPVTSVTIHDLPDDYPTPFDE